MTKKRVVIVLIFTMSLFSIWGWQAYAQGNDSSIQDRIPGSSVVLDPSWEIRVRRDTSYGLPNGSTHSSGISSIVWGNVFPQTALTVTLTRGGMPLIAQQVTSDQWGDFTISVDRLIEDGDEVQVSNAGSEKTVAVPVMTYQADPVSRVITGIAPAGITSIVPGSPHSLSMTLAGITHQITTSATGEFSVDFSDLNYLAGLVGTMRYTTPASDHVYKPVRVVDPLARGEYNDGWADIILGQPDFGEIVFNDVVDNHLFNPQGVHIDRSVEPNRLYVYDGGNSRVLGLSALGVCQAGPQVGEDCTTDTDCPGSVCQIESDRAADLLLGQSDWNSAACNGDSGFQFYPDVTLASADTLCTLREEQMSVSEGGSGVTMFTDALGNLYLPDFFNNRILRYDDPFGTDGTADYVWGQADFQGIFCNRGAGFSHPSAESLCLAPPPGVGELRAGVAVDPEGSLWVTDAWNNRVLRYSQDGSGIPAAEADLVLGQADFNSASDGSGLNQMHNPASILITSAGTVYVADSLNNRVLVFEPPFSNGMAATRVISGILNRPTGMGLDPFDGLWVNDNGNNRFIHYVGEVAQEIINSVDEEGGLGVDGDGNVFSAGSGAQSVIRFTAPGYPRANEILQAEPGGIFNRTTNRSLYGGHGLEIAAGQLIHGDESRLIFWNDLQSLQNHQPADGVIGAPDFGTRDRWGQRFQRMRADQNGLLWVIYKDASNVTSILAYQLPLVTGANPIHQISAPVPLLGGGSLSWSSDFALGGIDVQPECDCLWVTDEGTNRAFRIRDVSTQPVVDVVLGQLNITETGCNQGRGRDFPSQDSLCHPGALAFDRDGNLYIADHNLEFDGNLRLLEWDADQLPGNPASVVFGIPASRVFGRNNDFTEPNCLAGWQDPLCAPWEPAFDSQGRVVIGFNGYLGPRFPLVYQDLLNNPYPIAVLGDLHSMPLSARFDEWDNLYVVDHNRSRILIYKNEVIQTYSVSGQVTTTTGDPVEGIEIQAVGSGVTVTTNTSGIYTVTGLISGTYTIRPESDLYSFSPIERTVSVPPSAEGLDFVAVPLSYTLSGRVESASGDPIAGVDVVAMGKDTTLTVTTNISGNYLLLDLISGTYSIRPESDLYSFSPVERTVSVPPSAEGLDFVAVPLSYTLSGRVESASGEPIVGVDVVAIGKDITLTVTTNISGSYLLLDLISGTYSIRPESDLYSFSPIERTVTVPPSAEGLDFVAAQESYTLSGEVKTASGEPIEGIEIHILGSGVTVTTDITGSYTLTGLISGTYTIRPESDLYSFSPVEWIITVPPSAEGLDFIAIPIQQGFMLYLPLVSNPFPVQILVVEPMPPECLLNDTPAARTMIITGNNFPTGNPNLQLIDTTTGGQSIQFNSEVEWTSTSQLTLDLSKIRHLLWPENRLVLQARITVYDFDTGIYTPVSDWSPEFILAENLAACAGGIAIKL